MKATVVGGGLAGIAAALELADAGHEVTLVEARPTLGGAVQTLPERDGDPPPPPDNGQHIALGCCTEYLALLDRIGQAGAVRRTPLALPVIAENGRVSLIRPGALALLRYGHVGLRDRIAIGRIGPRARPPRPRRARRQDVRRPAPRARLDRAGDHALLGRLHATRPSTCPPRR